MPDARTLLYLALTALVVVIIIILVTTHNL